MHNLGYRDHTNEFFYNDSILKVLDVYRFQAGIYMFKNSNQSQFHLNHVHNTRFGNLPQSAFERLTLTQHSIEFLGPSIWNGIPDSIRDSSSILMFKNDFKRYLIDSYA